MLISRLSKYHNYHLNIKLNNYCWNYF